MFSMTRIIFEIYDLSSMMYDYDYDVTLMNDIYDI